MGIEIMDEVPCVDAIVIPVGGAGLIGKSSLYLLIVYYSFRVYKILTVVF